MVHRERQVSRRAFIGGVSAALAAASIGGSREAQGRAAPPRPARKPLPFPKPEAFPMLHGFNIVSALLIRTQSDPKTAGVMTSFTVDVPAHIGRIAALGFNQLRVKMNWESWELDREAFLAEAERIASRAEEAGVYVWFSTIHNYGVSSWFYGGNPYHCGFPYSLVTQYPPTRRWDTQAHKWEGSDEAEEKFWADWFARKVKSRSGRDGWDYNVEYLGDLIARLDRYSSVLGYELLNEPGVSGKPERSRGLGEYHTYVAKAIRRHTQKYIMVDRCYQRGNDGRSYEAWLDELWPKGVERVVFAPHRYAADAQDLRLFAAVARKHGAPVILGEWGGTTPAPVKEYLERFKETGMAWSYHVYGPGADATALVDDAGTPNAKMREILKARREVYGTEAFPA